MMDILSWNIQSRLEDDGKKKIIRSHETGGKKTPGNLTPTVQDIRSRQIQLVFHTQKNNNYSWLSWFSNTKMERPPACIHQF